MYDDPRRPFDPIRDYTAWEFLWLTDEEQLGVVAAAKASEAAARVAHGVGGNYYRGYGPRDHTHCECAWDAARGRTSPTFRG
ncbi:MAG TPA: hypothetical protein VM533_12425 [Fimbriiglobus sp.]|jgi:hypothetical protein|nr:hypothetical protein [Fimbriiglobus sp.]